MLKEKIVILFLLIGIGIVNPADSFSQTDSVSTYFKSTPTSIKDPISNIRMGGYFRFLGYVRNFHDMYDFDVSNYYDVFSCT